jgi:rare lipoprotein A
MTDRRVPKPLKAMLAGVAVLIALGGALAPGYAEEAAPAPQTDPALAAAFDEAMPRFVADPVVMDTAALEDELAAEPVTDELWEPLGSGTASYYAAKFDGRRTASGETFRNAEYTAAHRTLPFGTKGRVIDVSQAAARDLGLIGPGHATVTLALAAD